MYTGHLKSNAIGNADFELWSGGAMPSSRDIPLLGGVTFHVIKSWEFHKDGYRFLHGVALAWHNGRLYSSFGHNKGAENTSTEEARGRVSDDGGKTWGEVFTIDSGEEENLAVSHGVFLSLKGRLWSFHGAYYGTMEKVHTRSYLLNEDNGQWERKGVIIEGGFWPLQEPLKMNDGNWIMAGISVHGDCSAGGVHPAAVAISHGDNLTEWDLVMIPIRAPGRIWGESTVFLDGPVVVNIARYGEEAKALAALSKDYGRTWTDSQPSNLPMATSKPYAGTLSSGQHYLIGTTTANVSCRSPLTIALSRPGEKAFSEVFAIRHSLFPSGPGESHENLALSYPYAIEHDGKLYVAYSNNGGGVGRVGEGRELWNNNSAELAVIPLQSLSKG